MCPWGLSHGDCDVTFALFQIWPPIQVPKINMQQSIESDREIMAAIRESDLLFVDDCGWEGSSRWVAFRMAHIFTLLPQIDSVPA